MVSSPVFHPGLSYVALSVALRTCSSGLYKCMFQVGIEIVVKVVGSRLVYTYIVYSWMLQLGIDGVAKVVGSRMAYTLYCV